MKKCNEVMTKDPAAYLPTDMMAKATGLMKSENVGSIPVVQNEQSQVLIGIVTDRDLAMKIIAEGLDAKSTTVESVMTHQVITCLGDDDLQGIRFDV